MAAATEDRINAYVNVPARSLYLDKILASGETLYEKTLVTLNASDEAIELDHTDSEDDSGEVVFAVVKHFEHDGVQGNLTYDRAGTDGAARIHSDVIVGFVDGDGDTSGYSIGSKCYAVDNQTVSATQADGSAGSYAEAGTVYDIQGDEILVLVDGLIR